MQGLAWIWASIFHIFAPRLVCTTTLRFWKNLKKRPIFNGFWAAKAVQDSLGRPKKEPREVKIEAWRLFFSSWEGKSIPSCFWMHFWSFWEPLGEAKTSISCGRGCKNQVFGKLRFNIVLRPVLEGFGRPSWRQVGAKLGFIRVQNRIWKLLQS